MAILGKRTRPLTRGVHILQCPLIRDFTTFVSFPFSSAWAGYQCSFSTKSLLVFVVLKTVFCLPDSEGNGDGEISNYFRGQNSSLATRSHTQFCYISKLPNTFLFLPNHSEMRPQKSWKLVTPSS